MSVTPKQFEQLQTRLNKPRPVAGPVMGCSYQPSNSVHKIILGIDPSLRGTGFGVIQVAKPTPLVLAQGTISCPAGWQRSRCLANILTVIRDVISKTHPTVCAIEGLFFAQNLQTALIMGEARGASLAAVAEAGLEIYEISPRKVKQAIVGYGAAQKMAVAKMVQRMLKLSALPDPDAADALALALSFSQESNKIGITPPKRV